MLNFIKKNISVSEKENWLQSPFFAIYLGGLVFLFIIMFVFGWRPLQLNHAKLFVPTITRGIGGSDYHFFYYAGWRARLHKNFYFVNPAEPNPNELSEAFYIVQFVYPPLMAYFFVPFSLFPFNVSLLIYSMFTILLFFWSIYILGKFVRKKWFYFVVAALIFLFSPFFLLHLDHGQTNMPVMVLISVCLLFYIKKKYKIAGFLLALSIMFKLMPVIFLPYFFIKNRKVFYSALITCAIFLLLFGFNMTTDFMAAVSGFGGGSINAGGWSTSLGGLFYNRFTYDYISLSQAQKVVMALIVIISGAFYFLTYRMNKIIKSDADNNLILLEFGTLMFFVSFFPSVSALHNGLYYLFVFTAYWNLRPNLPIIYDYLLQALFYLSMSQGLLFPILGNQPYMTLFAFMSFEMFIIVILLWYCYFKQVNKQINTPQII
ncbi:MAG: glycosyltransferase family 87 protein [Patescibacteria group bacterium]